jgi:hypothetical protein
MLVFLQMVDMNLSTSVSSVIKTWKVLAQDGPVQQAHVGLYTW